MHSGMDEWHEAKSLHYSAWEQIVHNTHTDIDFTDIDLWTMFQDGIEPYEVHTKYGDYKYDDSTCLGKVQKGRISWITAFAITCPRCEELLEIPEGCSYDWMPSDLPAESTVMKCDICGQSIQLPTIIIFDKDGKPHAKFP